MKFDVVALGEPLFELNEQPDGRFLPGFGGDTSNAAIAAARLGAKTSYITLVGDDAPGKALLDLWDREGVNRQGVTVLPDAPTGLYLVTHGAAGHSFSYNRNGSAASFMEPDHIPADHIAAAKYLHVSAISQAISNSALAAVKHAIALAQRAGTAVSYDTNLRLRLWPIEQAAPVILATARQASVVKTSLEDAAQLVGSSDPPTIARQLRGSGHASVIVTLGGEGVFAARGEREFMVPARRVVAVDATGAGDAFTGALLAELCRGAALEEAVEFANAAAALSTLGFGAVAPLPERFAVNAFLAG